MSWKKLTSKSGLTLMTQDYIGRVQMLCMSVLLMSGGTESERKRCNSPLSVEKMLNVHVWIQLKGCQLHAFSP